MRIFVALSLPDDIRQDLCAVMGGVEGARWQTDAQLHMTLRFIGNVPDPVVRDVDATLSAIDFAPFDVQVQGVGLFGKPHHPRALWAGVRDSAELRHLQKKIEAALVRMGLPDEPRKFTPHITLARFGNRSASRVDRFLAEQGGLSLPPFTVSSMTLFESTLAHTGAIYVPLNHYPARRSPTLAATG